ncbi:hypothetical protein BHE74_00000624 [Ensete ventricosum]|nr:hypothetical protein BHE74_00000624 [Ensete ventricosum]
MAVRTARSKWPRRRKMSAVRLASNEHRGNRCKKLQETVLMEGRRRTSRSNSALWSRPTTTIKKSTKGHSAETLKPKAAEPFYQGSHDPFHRIGAKRPADAVAEMFNMLHKDYYTRSRRKPPINNSMPLKDPHVKP